MASNKLLAGSLLLAAACLMLNRPTPGSSHTDEVTFSRDVAPIFFKHCAECHRPNDMAPFSVLTYKDVQPWVSAIREKVAAREMPPWHADPRYGDFRNDARLSQKEIDTIAAWARQGAKEGNANDLPSLPDVVTDWQIGRPNRIFVMSQDYTIEPGVPDQYVYVTFNTTFTEDRWVQAAEIRPGNRRLVHHVIAHVLPPQSAAEIRGVGGESLNETKDARSIFYKEGSLARVRLDAPVINDGANTPNGGAVFKPRGVDDGSGGFSMLLASYAPGKGPDVYPPGMAKKIPAGSKIVLQIHYSSFHGMLHQAEKDRTAVALVFAREPPEQRIVTLTIPNHFFKIPPGSANERVTAAYTFDQEVKLLDYMPHMHMRGKDMKYEAIYPDGKRETLLWVPQFNFNWQTMYQLKNPITLPAGTRIIITAHFDNSARNKYNPDSTRAVRWGDPTTDEMMIGWLDYVVPNSPNSKAVTVPPRPSPK